MSAPHPEVVRAQELHHEIRGALREHHRAKLELARLLCRMKDERLYAMLGFGGIYDYARQTLDLEARHTRELLCLGQRLSDLPQVEAALQAGELAWTKAREIGRVATPETEEAWLARAQQVTSRALEHEVAGAVVGELPPEGEPVTHVGQARVRVVLDMEAQEAQLFRDALARAKAKAGPEAKEVGDGAILIDMARRVLAEDDEHPPVEERYTVVLEHCPSCGQTEGEGAEVGDSLRAEAQCDSQVVDMRPGPDQGRRSRTIPPRVRRQVRLRDRRRCVVPGCTNRLWLDIHHLRHFADGGSNDASNLACVCSIHHRLHHEGRLGIEAMGAGRVRYAFPDGRVIVRKLGEPGWDDGWLRRVPAPPFYERAAAQGAPV